MRASPMSAPNWIAGALSSDTEECLLWPYAKLKNGYGQLKNGNTSARVHRLICEKAHGPPPSPKHEAAHWCGNRACGNPKHIRWATPKENHADQIRHGTINRGSRHGQVKLHEANIVSIRQSSRSLSSLAQEYGVSPAAIRDVKIRKTWSWVKDTNSPSP